MDINTQGKVTNQTKANSIPTTTPANASSSQFDQLTSIVTALQGVMDQFVSIIGQLMGQMQSGGMGMSGSMPMMQYTSVKYDNQNLIVNGKTYSPEPEAKVPDDNRLVIVNSLANQATVKQLIAALKDIQILDSYNAIGGYAVQVAPDYLSQWKMALTDNLPKGSSVFYNEKIPAAPATPAAAAPKAAATTAKQETAATAPKAVAAETVAAAPKATAADTKQKAAAAD